MLCCLDQLVTVQSKARRDTGLSCVRRGRRTSLAMARVYSDSRYRRRVSSRRESLARSRTKREHGAMVGGWNETRRNVAPPCVGFPLHHRDGSTHRPSQKSLTPWTTTHVPHTYGASVFSPHTPVPSHPRSAMDDIVPVRGVPLQARHSKFQPPRSYYIVGNLLSSPMDHTAGGTPVVAAVTKTTKGWKCRSTVRGAVCHDYMSHESIGHVRHWIQQQDLHPNCLSHRPSRRSSGTSRHSDWSIGRAFGGVSDPGCRPDTRRGGGTSAPTSRARVVRCTAWAAMCRG